MAFRRAQFDRDNQARLAALIPHANVTSAESVEDAIGKQLRAPILCTLYEGGRSAGREIARNKGQTVDVKLTIVVIAENWHSKAEGRDGVYDLLDDVEQAIVDWQNPQTSGGYIYVSDDFMMRKGPRIAYQIEFRASAWNDYQAAA